jgi:pimeloyl-ACP methyl ester carboxylesterase
MAQKHVVYLIPGQGADERLFKNIVLDSVFEVRHVRYFTPEKNWTMKDFAHELAKQIDTTRSFSIVGVSLGGMLATEMTDFLHPEKVILISSAKTRYEFPFRYRFQKDFPLYKIVPAKVEKAGARILQPIVEPDRSKDVETFKSMLEDKDPLFLKRTIKMILEWNRVAYDPKIIHIHGEIDHTIPIRNVSCDYRVENGSHMMVLTRGPQISKMLNQILLQSH